MTAAHFNAATAIGDVIAMEGDKLYSREAGTCGLQFDPDGNLDHDTPSTGFKTGADPGPDEWLRGNPIAGVGAGWELRCTVVSGALNSGPVGVWTSLSSAVVFDVIPNGTAELTFDFRRAGTTSIAYTAYQVRLLSTFAP